MKKASLLASAALAAFSSAASAQDIYPEITTPGFANEVDSLIREKCPNSVYDDGNMPQNIACANVTLEATSKLLIHLSDYIKDETGKTISNFWASSAQTELLRCAIPLDRAQREGERLNSNNIQAGLAFMERANKVAIGCLENIYEAENGIEAWLDTKAKNHLVDLLNCQVNPKGCVRLKSLDL